MPYSFKATWEALITTVHWAPLYMYYDMYCAMKIHIQSWQQLYRVAVNMDSFCEVRELKLWEFK